LTEEYSKKSDNIFAVKPEFYSLAHFCSSVQNSDGGGVLWSLIIRQHSLWVAA